MTRSRSRRLRLIPSHLPLIRDKIVEKQRKRLKRQHDATQYREALAAAWDEADQMATAQLWWISRDMAKLAADTAAVGDYPKNRPPAASGVMIIDGGLPVDASPVGFKANIDGFFWVVSGGETTVYPMTDDPETLEKTGAADVGLPVDLMSGSGALADAADANAALLRAWVDFAQAVWALSEETRICQAKPGEPSAVHPLPSRFDPEIRKVKMLVLRENLHRPGESADDDGRVRREYSHRFIVRGFWRDQAMARIIRSADASGYHHSSKGRPTSRLSARRRCAYGDVDRHDRRFSRRPDAGYKGAVSERRIAMAPLVFG